MDATIVFEQCALKFFGKERLSSFEDKLLLNNSKYGTIKTFLALCILEGIILLPIGMILSSTILPSKPIGFVGIGIISFFIPFFVNYIVQDLIFENNKRKKEGLLPDLLLETSVFCDETSFLKTIEKIATQEYGLVSKDFSRAFSEIKKGESIELAITRIKLLNKSKTYARVIDLLLQGYNNGTKLSIALKETAEDILESQSIQKERQAILLVTKYTLLISAGIIVPALIGVMIGLVSSFNVSSLDEIGFGLSIIERTALFEMSKISATMYIIEYSLLASYFLGISEGNKKNFFIYASILIPLSIVIFFVSQTIL